MSNKQLIQTRHGPMYAYPDDRFLGEAICKYGEYSEREYQFLADVLEGYEHPGQLIIEAGANAGYLTIPLSKHATVMAFEPQESVWKLLSENAGIAAKEAAHFRHVIILANNAVGERNGSIRCPRHSYETAGNHGGIPMGENQYMAAMQAKEWDNVLCVTLDGNIRGVVKLIKADVEGMELSVLRGARELIAKDKPLLYLENDRPHQSEALIRAVWKMGYWCAWHCPPLYNKDNFFGVEENLYPKLHSINMICIPEGRRLPDGVATKHGLSIIEDATQHPVTGM